MRLLALELFLSLLDVRGHIPRFDDFRPTPVAPAPAGTVGALAAAVGVFAVLSLVIWAAVWLATHLF
ncbi:MULTISPECIES: hypothetical protein [Bradyrhizobium]|uniref:hypothetical protein n=1 Tax=Bradyrhizobium TaxID=374 RepID=UPI001BAB9ABC|nr:hypothetical protein [Bradyrhizobium liaoningense]MBR0985698.1 hypothetical protein [Bradyrhizobium liaoningense]GMP03819.1 hypothetical protein TM239_36380 [Bradyrhizobium sp. TM239]